MMRTPEVSVVMGVYNGADRLPASIESILTQEGVDLEFIIVNDGSTDATAEVLAEYGALDPRVRVLEQRNQGLTRALIQGCAAARGPWIARQDADDTSLPGRLAAQVALLRSNANLAFVSCWSEIVGPENEPLLLIRREHGAEKATRLFLQRLAGPPGHGSVMFRRSAYEDAGGYRAELYYAQDNDLWLRLAGIGLLDYVPEVLYRYQVSPDSISGHRHPLKVQFARIIDELHTARLDGVSEASILERARQLPIREGTGTGRRKNSEDLTLYFIARCLMRRHNSRAWHYLLECLRRNPFHVRAWLSLPWAGILQLKKAIATENANPICR